MHHAGGAKGVTMMAQITKSIPFLVLILLLLVIISCAESDEKTQSSERVITIGNLTDQTGPAASAMSIIDTSLEDMAHYYNEQNLIPGITFRVVHYDGQYDSALDVPGYQKLKQEGADVIFTGVSSSVMTLKPRLERDEIILFTVAPTSAAVNPPGNVFVPGSPLSEDLSYTLLKWVSENDPDFPQDRSAKVGGAFWAEVYGDMILTGAKEYATTHPEQYDWVDGYLASFSFDWGTEVEGLKECDYVIPPIPMNSFAQQYRNAGGKAKFIGTHAHDAFIDQIDKADLWDEMDGMYFIRASEWWTDEDSSMVKMMGDLLKQNHPGRVDEIRRMGNGYLCGYNFHVMFQIIAEAVELVGPDNFGPQAIIEAAESFSLTIDDVERERLSENERVCINYLTMYELRADGKDLFRVEPKWNPVVSCPK